MGRMTPKIVCGMSVVGFGALFLTMNIWYFLFGMLLTYMVLTDNGCDE